MAKADSHSGEQFMEQNIASAEDLGYCNQGGGGNSGRGRRAPLEALGITAETEVDKRVVLIHEKSFV